jgi:hypothetical protein
MTACQHLPPLSAAFRKSRREDFVMDASPSSDRPPRIDVKNEECLQFTPSGQIFIPNDPEILQKTIP